MKLPILILCIYCFGAAHAQPFEPVNKNASPEAKKLLSYLYAINGKKI